MATRKKRSTTRKRTTTSAKRSAAAKKGWRTRRAGMSGLAGTKRGRRPRNSSTKEQCSIAGRRLKKTGASAAGRRLATSKRRGGCK